MISNDAKPTTGISIKTFIKMLLCGLVCGIFCGGACVLFSWATTICDRVFHANDWLIFILPAAGVLIVLLFDYLRRGEDLCTDALFRYLHGDPVKNVNGNPNKVSIWLAPLMFISTCLAYLFGGSVGRVGSALQIGGTLGLHVSDGLFGGLFRDLKMRHVPLACGMAAGFTAILNAPISGAIFGVEVLVLSGSQLLAAVPSAIAAFTTWIISRLAHVPYVDFHFNMTGGLTEPGSTSDDAAMSALYATGLELEVIFKVMIIAFVGTLVGRLFCYSRLISTRAFELISNRFLRVLAGSGIVVGLTLLVGVTDYNGIGFVYVDATFSGESAMLAFMWKLILTCLTLGCGIRGGEIAPTIFIGATACFTVGCLIGLDPTLAAALGLVGALASVTNAPVSIGIFGCEAICFSGEAVLYFALAAAIAHIFSGTYGLYHEQLPQRQPLKFRIP